MRVAMMGPYPPDPRGISGGVEAVIVTLLRGLRRFPDLQLEVITCREGIREAKTLPGDEWSVHLLPYKRLGRLTLHRREVGGLMRRLRQLKPDIVHAHGVGIYAEAALRSGYPAVLTLHGVVFREARFARGLPDRVRWKLDSWYERFCLSRATDIISISPYLEREYGSVLKARVYRVENPVDDDFFRLRGRESPHRILNVASFIPRKGILELLEAMVRVRAAFPSAELHLAGNTTIDPEYHRACRERAAALGLQGAVHFRGPLTRDQLLEEFARCSLFVLSSFQETAPVTIEEAMAAGKAIVATRVGGVPYLIAHGETGLLVDCGDVEGLAQAMLALLRDASLRARLGKRAREEAQVRFRTSLIARKTRDVYEEVLARHSPRGRGH